MLDNVVGEEGPIGGHTWRSRENGRHDLNVLFVSMLVMKDEQLEVMLLLNPMSKGTGNWLVASGVAAIRVLDNATVVVAVPDTVDVELDESFEACSSRRLRSPAVSCSACSLSGVHAGSARSGPNPARPDADPDPRPSSWASIICSSMYAVAEENERQHVRNIKKKRWVVWIER